MAAGKTTQPSGPLTVGGRAAFRPNAALAAVRDKMRVAPQARAVAIQRVKAYRVQGGGGFESQGILAEGPNGLTMPLKQQHKQFNFSVGDPLHADYFLREVRQGLGDIYEFNIDDTLFNTWIAKAAIPQNNASTNPNRTWKPPNDAISKELVRKFEALVHPVLIYSLQRGLTHEAAKEVASEIFAPVLGVWAGGPNANGEWPSVPAPRVGDTKQPSYKVECGPPWNWIISHFVTGGQKLAETETSSAKLTSGIEELHDLTLLEKEINDLIKVAESNDRKAQARQLTKLRKELKALIEVEAFQGRTDEEERRKIYDEFHKLKRKIYQDKPEMWFETTTSQ